MSSPIQVYLNSNTATDYLNGTSKSDMVFYTNSPIVPPVNYNMTLKVVNLYVPISFTLINANNDVFIFNSHELKIPHGNYNATELQKVLTELVSPYDATWGVSFYQPTNKYTFTSTLSNFTLDGSCLYLLGFITAKSSSGLTLTSEVPINLTGDNIIYLDIPNISTFNLSSASGSRTSIVGSVLVDIPYGSVLYFNDTSDTRFVVQEDHISFWHIKLVGEDQITPLDLNNLDWGLTLEISFVPKTFQPSFSQTYKDTYTKYLEGLIK